MFLLCGLLGRAQQWESKLASAETKAQANGCNIILVFSGSDWCGPCIKLDKTIWQSEEFKSYAKDHWVLLRADFPRKKENRLAEAQVASNAKLAEAYNPKGYFPLVVVLDAHGKVLGETGYKKLTPKEYIAHLNGIESGR